MDLIRDRRRSLQQGSNRADPEHAVRNAHLVLFVSVSGVIGGVDTYLLNNARQLFGEFQFWVLLGYPTAKFMYNDRAIGRVIVFPLTKVSSLMHFPSVLRQLRGWKRITIHTNDLVTCLWGKLFSLLLGPAASHITTIHSVLTEHRIFGRVKHFVVFSLNRLLARVGQAGFICVSNQVRLALLQVGVRNSHMHVVYSGIDVESLLASRRNGQKTELTRIGFVGRLSREKGPDLFINLVNDLPAGYEAHVFGEGEKRWLFLGDRGKGIVFHGFLSNIKEIYSSLDIVCITSRTESMSFVLVEALALGCAVLALRLPVFEELLSSSPLKQKILCSDVDEMRRRMLGSDRSFLTYEKQDVLQFLRRFDINGYGKKLGSIYEQGQKEHGD